MTEFGERYADPLYAALQAHGFGDLTGGNGQPNESGGLDWISIDLRLTDLDHALEFARRTLQKLGAPPGSEIEYTAPDGQTITRLIADPLKV